MTPDEIRKLIIEVMSSNGGHLASNLGSVEITLALHKVFDSPKDKFIFDTSHQTYAHKILTGRKETFHTMRQFNGLCGFANPKESPHDHFYAGHAGTGLSLALGVAGARDLNGQSEHVIPIISDAPFGCGLTLEALNNLPKNLKNFIIVLNDNAVAISKGVGNIHHNILGSFGFPRKTLAEARKFFEFFNLEYVGPIDGHNLDTLTQTLESVKNRNHPVIIHALTIKGYGMPKAVEDPITFHGFSPSSNPKPTFPKIFGRHLLKMAENDPKIVTITPAMPRGSCLDALMEKYPNRCFDVGIAEGHAVTFAGGLAYQSKMKVVACIYSTFFQRAFDNLFQDVCLQELPVVFALDRAGFSPSDGTTHHGIYDISFLNAMPHMVIAQPRNGDLLKDLLESAFSYERPTAIRYPNMQTEESDRDIIHRSLGKGEVLAKGKDIVIIGLGHMCQTALGVRDLLLEQGIEATVVDPIFVKPLDSALFFQLMLDHHYFVTIEEHAVNSGLGAIFNSFAAQSGFSEIQVQNFGIPDQFIEQGSKHKELIEYVGLTPQLIANQIIKRFVNPDFHEVMDEDVRHLPQ